MTLHYYFMLFFGAHHVAICVCRTIIGLLAALFDEDAERRVLLCAPSNAAVDELVRRVASVHYVPRKGACELKLVRFGAPSSAHHTVSKYVLDL